MPWHSFVDFVRPYSADNRTLIRLAAYDSALETLSTSSSTASPLPFPPSRWCWLETTRASAAFLAALAAKALLAACFGIRYSILFQLPKESPLDVDTDVSFDSTVHICTIKANVKFKKNIFLRFSFGLLYKIRIKCEKKPVGGDIFVFWGFFCSNSVQIFLRKSFRTSRSYFHTEFSRFTFGAIAQKPCWFGSWLIFLMADLLFVVFVFIFCCCCRASIFLYSS